MLSLLATGLIAQIHPARFTHGVVVSDSQIASEVGAAILKKGGNAVDAAVATGFALAVTFPAAGNLGGGGFMLVRMANGERIAVDYREVAPRRSTKDMYKNPADSLTGYLASGVPGTPLGMWEAHKKFGKLKWAEVVDPAIILAAKGFEVSDGLARGLESMGNKFQRFPASWSQFCRNGRFYKAGEVIRQPDLAKTLTRLRDQGPKGFYEGETARLIEVAMGKNGGIIDAQDLKSYRVVMREPLAAGYQGYRVFTMPPPSSGGIALLQMLGMVYRDFATMGFQSSEMLHIMVEAMKRAFADRSVYLGDPEFVDVPVAKLIDPSFLMKRRDAFTNRATPSAEIKGLSTPSGNGMDTTHYSVVDAQGNAVANTYTLNTGYGSAVVIPGTGVLMNNEMDDFTTQPGKPNVFGLIQSEKNNIAPGKRPLSSMTPTIIVEGEKVILVVGSPGGPTIINTVFQTIVNVIDFRMNVQVAVSAPRFHHQWMPDEIVWEPYGLTSDVRRNLEARGHKVSQGAMRMGSCHSIQIDKSGARLAGVDPRVAGSGAVGY